MKEQAEHPIICKLISSFSFAGVGEFRGACQCVKQYKNRYYIVGQ